jgi:serine/threonine-protein kinase
MNEELDRQHKPYSKYRPKDDDKFSGFNMTFDTKKALPYLYVTGIFLVSVYLLLLIFDAWIMPAMVHNRDLVKVPEVTGSKLRNASSILKQHGLNYSVSTQQYSEEYPPETVIKQVPNSSTEVKVGRTVYLTVSKGKETVAVPHLIGLHLSTARFELMKRGFQLGEISYEFSDYIPKDSVMRQSKNSGLLIPYGQIIDLVISKGSDAQTPVPMLIGYTLEEVKAILSEKGFVLGEVQYMVSDTFTSNTVIGQSPGQSELAPLGASIDVIVAK